MSNPASSIEVIGTTTTEQEQYRLLFDACMLFACEEQLSREEYIQWRDRWLREAAPLIIHNLEGE